MYFLKTSGPFLQRDEKVGLPSLVAPGGESSWRNTCQWPQKKGREERRRWRQKIGHSGEIGMMKNIKKKKR